MKTTLFLILLYTLTTSAQSAVTIPATNGSLPAPGANGCAQGYSPGIDTVLYTVPYTYTQVLSIIGNYTNLTWSGSPDNSVTSNSTNWVPGTARFYDIAGAHVIETITEYQKPANGPYIEVHTLAPLSIAAANISFYGDYDAQNWTSICDGKATTTNFTINFCATNATLAASLLHGLHLTDAQTVGMFLGGMNFTSCAALGSGASATTTGGAAMFTGGASQIDGGRTMAVVFAVMALSCMMWL